MTADLGTLVLAGSGEYTPMMDIVDRFLLERHAGREILLIATSCALEGQDVMTRWEEMGVAHFKRLGAEAQPLRIRDNADANQEEYAGRIAEAGIVWFSGGSPPYLALSFHQTLCWQALESANRRGAAVAGASGGLGVLNDHVTMPAPAPGAPASSPLLASYDGPNALGLAAPVRALAHFDRMEARRPEFVERVVANLQPGQMAVGVDEDTAVVWTEGAWRAMGHKRVVVFQQGGSRAVFKDGDHVDLLPPPLRASPSGTE
jgi:cyanophycinase